MRLTNSLTVLFLYSCLGFCASSIAQIPDYSSLSFSLPQSSKELLIADINNDQEKDLLIVMEDRLRIYFQQNASFDFESNFDDIVFEGQSVGWDLSNAYNASAATEVIGLIDGKKVMAWQAQGMSLLPAREINSQLNGFLGKGLNRLYFSQDINGDELADLVIPGAGKLDIHIQQSNGEYQAPLAINSNFRIRTNLESSRLDRRLGQAIRIPSLELRDLNNDQRNDLISKTEDQLNVFLAQANGSSYFSPQATFSLNLLEIEERLGEFDIDNLDFSNLTGILALTHEEILEDINGDNIDDLLLREGGKVSVFTGTDEGISFDAPTQVLRSGGNVLSTFLYDENEDGLKDLWLWRVEPISVGDIFVWLALSGSIAVEAFIYPNQGDTFARRPARKITIALKFPSVIRLTNSFNDLEDEVKAAAESNDILNVAANIDGETDNEELLQLIDQQLTVFLDAVEPKPESTEFLGALGYSRNKDDYVIDLKEILDNAAQSNPYEHRDSEVNPGQALMTLPTAEPVSDITAVLINQDSSSDFIVFENPGSGLIKGMLLLSN